jgi:hypothetical protein
LANHIYVICRSADVIPMSELQNHIATLGLLDERPRFDPSAMSAEAGNADWSVFQIVYREGKRPIHVFRLTGNELKPAIEDAMEFFSENCEPDDHRDVAERIRTCRQMIHFELGLEVPDDVWEMLDATESYIASSLDGIVFASDGFYDSDLQPICQVE